MHDQNEIKHWRNMVEYEATNSQDKLRLCVAETIQKLAEELRSSTPPDAYELLEMCERLNKLESAVSDHEIMRGELQAEIETAVEHERRRHHALMKAFASLDDGPTFAVALSTFEAVGAPDVFGPHAHDNEVHARHQRAELTDTSGLDI